MSQTLCNNGFELSYSLIWNYSNLGSKRFRVLSEQSKFWSVQSCCRISEAGGCQDTDKAMVTQTWSERTICNHMNRCWLHTAISNILSWLPVYEKSTPEPLMSRVLEADMRHWGQLSHSIIPSLGKSRNKHNCIYVFNLGSHISNSIKCRKCEDDEKGQKLESEQSVMLPVMSKVITV